MSETPAESGAPQPIDAAGRIRRGVRRHLYQQGWASLPEFTLATGRRADLFALAPDGTALVVEIKSGLADYRADAKWHEYRDYCDRFYFAIDANFPSEIIPAECGLIIADAWGAEIVRESSEIRLAPARRKALTLAFARLAADRTLLIEDPGLPASLRAGRPV
ncbi:MmcB family DNA repair protein [Radicibacter daui]|uniref:MmcB family DNA repair protein n=1 Tax=Radicibacter daui TaxID=3064829 RepID=UPI004046E2E0